ncbi:hypothetical protein QAD02_019826 [Eretmocerus hayati]|uniref:Uncharacterized protein n=1 Tax=Eretmocerus hayati TaxID=131215 RepID=A0ACC2PN73_9HYME|nr:hypothetical protein QAD02_019826 [Eretmocerus hayati]
MAPRKNESSEGSKKGERSENFTNAEKNTFVELLPQFKDKIECKRTDAMTRQEKKQAWADLVEAFNIVSSHTPRTEENLRNLWESMKKAAKKMYDHTRIHSFNILIYLFKIAGGGGEKNPSKAITPANLTVLGILGPAGVGMSNACDGDSAQTSELNASYVACNDGSINEAVNGNTDASGSLSGKDDQV